MGAPNLSPQLYMILRNCRDDQGTHNHDERRGTGRQQGQQYSENERVRGVKGSGSAELQRHTGWPLRQSEGSKGSIAHLDHSACTQ